MTTMVDDISEWSGYTPTDGTPTEQLAEPKDTETIDGSMITLSTGAIVWVGRSAQGSCAVKITSKDKAELQFALTPEATEALVHLIQIAGLGSVRGHAA